MNFKFDAVNREDAKHLYQTQLASSVKASLLTTQSAYEGMVNFGFGRILTIGTNLVQNPVVSYHDYNTSKFSH